MKKRDKGLARQIAFQAGLRMGALSLALFLSFGVVHLVQGVRQLLLNPLDTATARLERKLSDGELLLAAPPAEGLPTELRFLQTLEQNGVDLVILLEDGRAVWYDEAAGQMTEGPLPDPFSPEQAAKGIQLRLDPEHGWMATAGARVEDPAGGSALVLAALPLGALAQELLPVLAMLTLSTLAAVRMAVWLSRQLTRRLIQPLGAMKQALAAWRGDRYDPPPALPGQDELGELRDAMEQTARQLEQARDRRQQEDETRRQFFADISHELKTPLAVLRARAELMRDGMVDPEEVPVQAEGMLTELEQLQTVVQDLLTLARMQAPGYTVERQVCSLSEILRDAGRSLAQLARKQGVEFALELPECDPARDRVLTHYDRMRQLVMILGENGIKYTKPGGRAGMRLEYRPEGPVVLVWDQGIGIPPEEQGRVFDRFYRGVNRAASPGEGLGLAIARQLSELLEAPVQLESTGPEGSLFSLRPPAAK